MGPRESLSPKPGYNGLRSVSGMTPRPSSEMMPGRSDSRTPEAEQIDQWFKHLASWETTLEEMAAASTDQNFTEELGAIEQWFRVLSEAERTAALYSLLQHSTPVQIRFFLSVLQHMAQSDPMAALLSPNPNQAQMDQRLSALRPEDRNKLKQNRISAPGTLVPHERWQGQLDQVAERGNSPDPDRRSPTPEMRPKSHHYEAQPSPRPTNSPMASWASMTNTPLVPSFTDPKLDQFANLSLNNVDGRFRRRNVSGHYNDDGEFVESGQQPGRASPQPWPRSPVIDQYGLGGLGIGADPHLAGLGMSGNAQLLALAQAQAQQLSTAASFAQSGFGGRYDGLARRSPMLKPTSPTPDRPAGGGAGGGAGVAGPDDVDPKTISDVTNWLRVLRLHKYTANFAKSSWKDMVNMNEADLEAKGVNAQGARTKFLKVFYNVRIKMDMPHPEGQEEYAPK